MIDPHDDAMTTEGGIEVAPGVRAAALRIQFSRSGGPGGQNVNKINSKVQLWVALADLSGLPLDAKARLRGLAGSRLTAGGDIHIASDTHRTQAANRREVMDRLRELIVQAQKRPKTRRKTRPGKAARERRLAGKRQRSQVKSLRRTTDE
jgi:ribosome-associated protein